MALGSLIQQVFEERQMKHSVFADRIGLSRQSVYKLFEKESLDTNLLLRISEVLEYDFFRHFQFEAGSSKMHFQKSADSNFLPPNARLQKLLWEQAQARARIVQLEDRISDKDKLIELLRNEPSGEES